MRNLSPFLTRVRRVFKPWLTLFHRLWNTTVTSKDFHLLDDFLPSTDLVDLESSCGLSLQSDETRSSLLQTMFVCLPEVSRKRLHEMWESDVTGPMTINKIPLAVFNWRCRYGTFQKRRNKVRTILWLVGNLELATPCEIIWDLARVEIPICQ